MNALVASVFKRTVEIGQVQFVRMAQQTWHAMQRLKKQITADWTALYKMVQRARDEASTFDRAIAEHERVVEQLQNWVMVPGPVSVSVNEVSRTIQRQRELSGQINSLVHGIAEYNQQIQREALRLLREEPTKWEAQERKWTELKSLLEHAEKSSAPTLWAWGESVWRRQWLSAYERSYRYQLEDVKAWLERPFDPSPAVQRQNARLQPLAGQTIRCWDGQIELRLARLEGKNAK